MIPVFITITGGEKKLVIEESRIVLILYVIGVKRSYIKYILEIFYFKSEKSENFDYTDYINYAIYIVFAV